MDAGLSVLLLSGEDFVLHCQEDAPLLDLKHVIAAKIGLQKSEAQTCGFFTVDDYGMDVFLPDVAPVRSVPAEKHSLLHRVIFTVIFPDLQGFRRVFDEPALARRTLAPALFTPASPAYRSLVMHHALDALRRGRLLEGRERRLDKNTDFAAHLLALAYGGLIATQDDALLADRLKSFFSPDTWDGLSIQPLTQRRVLGDARGLATDKAPDALVDDAALLLANLSGFQRLSVPAVFVANMVNGPDGKLTRVPESSNTPVRLYLSFGVVDISLKNWETLDTVFVCPMRDLRQIYCYADGISLALSRQDSSRPMHVNLSVLHPESILAHIRTFLRIVAALRGRA